MPPHISAAFGLTTLLSNLLYTAPIGTAARRGLSSWESEYLFGVSHETYEVVYV